MSTHQQANVVRMASTYPQIGKAHDRKDRHPRHRPFWIPCRRIPSLCCQRSDADHPIPMSCLVRLWGKIPGNHMWRKKNISHCYKMLQTKNIEEHCFLLSCPTESHASVPRCPVPSDRPSDQWPHWCFQFSQGPLHGKLATPGPVWILQVGGQGSHRNTGWWHAMHVYYIYIYIYILLYYYYIYIYIYVCVYVRLGIRIRTLYVLGSYMIG